jgi:hypothetical protein
MSTAILAQRQHLEESIAANSFAESADNASRFGALETELRNLRAEIAELRETLIHREQNGATLMEAYRSLLSDIASLIQSQKEEGVKREESLRFFLASFEARLKSDLRAEIGFVAEDEDEPDGNWWPFRRAR